MHPKSIYDVRWRKTVYFSVKLQRNYVVLQIAYSIICLLSCKILEYITYILLKFSYNVTISSLMWKTQSYAVFKITYALFAQCNYFFVSCKNLTCYPAIVHLPLSRHNYVVITLNYERITSLSVGYCKVLQEIGLKILFLQHCVYLVCFNAQIVVFL